MTFLFESPWKQAKRAAQTHSYDTPLSSWLGAHHLSPVISDSHPLTKNLPPAGVPLPGMPWVKIQPVRQGEMDKETGNLRQPDHPGTNHTTEEGGITRCPFINTTARIHRDPGSLFYMIWDGTKSLLRWIVWNYVDFYNLITHPLSENQHDSLLAEMSGIPYKITYYFHVAWRGIIVVAITFGLIEIGPLMLTLTEWFRIFWDIVKGFFGLVGKASDDLWSFIQLIIRDLQAFIYRVRL